MSHQDDGSLLASVIPRAPGTWLSFDSPPVTGSEMLQTPGQAAEFCPPAGECRRHLVLSWTRNISRGHHPCQSSIVRWWLCRLYASYTVLTGAGLSSHSGSGPCEQPAKTTKNESNVARVTLSVIHEATNFFNFNKYFLEPATYKARSRCWESSSQ